ncbi:MAG: radical SAM protein [Elusimicrobiota bacterium]|nr:radical SAM protein [Elusimicrobiota bacterium]
MNNSILSSEKNLTASAKFHITIISLYSYGAFGSRILKDILKNNSYTASNIFFKKDKTNSMSLPTEQEYELLINLLKQLNPDIIGISTRSTFFPVAKNITQKIKKITDSPILWGGAHPTICPEESIQFADIICIGDGEKAMLELVDKLSKHQEISAIKGLWIKKNNSVIKNDPQTLFEDLDGLPLPDYDDKNTYAIENNSVIRHDPLYNNELTHYNFMSGRGCPFHCDFCSNSILKKIFEGKGHFIRQRSVENVIEELKSAKKRFKKLEVISSNDEVFTLNKEWLKEFCRKYKNEINLPFHCDIHPSFVSEETINLLKYAGLKTITMGIQSGSEKIRTDLYGRKTPESVLKKNAYIFKKNKIFPSFDLIFDNPLETVDDIKKTYNFMFELPRPYRINMYSLQHHPRTKLTEKLLSEKLISINEIDGISLKGFNQWHVNLYNKLQNPEMLFYYKLFELLSSFIVLSEKNPGRVVMVFPLWFIRLIEKNMFLKKWPYLMNWVAFMPKITFGLGLLIQGKLKRLTRSIIYLSKKN